MPRRRREHGADEPADEEVVASGDQDGRKNDEGEGRCEGALYELAVGLGGSVGMGQGG